MGAVCSWWRAVLLEAELLGDLILNNIPIFVIRSRHLESFLVQHASFIHWLERRAPRIRGCILQAERWEDDGASLRLRVATAQVLGPHLTSLKLVSTGGGQVTSTFLQHGQQLRQLQVGGPESAAPFFWIRALLFSFRLFCLLVANSMSCMAFPSWRHMRYWRPVSHEAAVGSRPSAHQPPARDNKARCPSPVGLVPSSGSMPFQGRKQHLTN